MRILHTSDWHIGRTFHGHSTLAAITEVLGSVPRIVADNQVDVVIAAGDIFDSATPSGDAFDILRTHLLAIREAGAKVVMTSGNHDSAARLGFASPFTELAGIHLVTNPDTVGQPITVSDDEVTVDFYAVPYLEPALIRHRWSEQPIRNQAEAMGAAMARIRPSIEARAETGARSIVVAHTFVAGSEAESADSERPITVGTVDRVPIPVFDGVDYVALGHIHGRMELSPSVRYSGALVHYSFSEAGKPRGGWLIDVAPGGVSQVQWVDVPVPRPLAVLTGELDHLLTADEFAAYQSFWVNAVLTDSTRPMDAMRRLHTRFPWCAHVEFRPPAQFHDGHDSYAARVHGKTDSEVFSSFLAHVRNGEGPTAAEEVVVAELLAQARKTQVSR